MPKGKSSPKAETEPRCGCGCEESCCGGSGLPGVGCCQVADVVSVDARGQMVLPKKVRKAIGLKPNGKLAVIAWKQGEKMSCLTLIKADDLADSIRQAYGPMLVQLIQK